MRYRTGTLPRHALVLLLLATLGHGCSSRKPTEDVQQSVESPASETVENSPAAPKVVTLPGERPVSKSLSPLAAGKTQASPAAVGSGFGHYNGSRQTVVAQSTDLRALAVSPDGRWLAVARQTVGGAGGLQIWDVAKAVIVIDQSEPLGVTAIGFSEDSRTVAYGTGDYTVGIMSIPDGAVVRLTGHAGTVRHLAFSLDDRRLATVGYDRQLIVWDVSRKTAIDRVVVDKQQGGRSVSFIAEDRLCLLTTGQTVRCYRLGDGSLQQETEVQLAESTWPLAFDRDKLYAVMPDRSLYEIDAASGESVPIWTAESSPEKSPQSRPLTLPNALMAVAVARQSRELGVVSAEGDLIVWKQSEPTARESWNLGFGNVVMLSVDRDGRYWAALTAAGGLVLFDRMDAESVRQLEPEVNPGRVPSRAIRFGRSGNSIAVASDARTLVLTSLDSGLQLRRIKRAETSDATPVNVILAVTDKTILCGTESGKVERWPVVGVVPELLDATSSAVTALAEAPDGRILIGDADGRTTWIDAGQTAGFQSQQEHNAAIHAAAFSPDGRWAVTAGDDHQIVVWDVLGRTRALRLAGHARPVRAVTFNADGRLLLSGDLEGVLIAWDVRTGTQQWSVTLDGSLMSSRLVPERGPVLSPSTGTADDGPSATEAKPSGEGGITAMALSDNQRVLAVGTAAGYVQTFDVSLRQPLSAVFYQSPISDLMFSGDGASLLAATLSGAVVRRWRAPAFPVLLAGHQGTLQFVALDASGNRAVTGGQDRQLRVWDVGSGTMLHALDNEGEAIVSGALSPDGKRAVTASYGSGIVFWDLNRMTRLGKRYGHQKRVTSLAFSPDGVSVASGCDDKTVRIWDFATQKTRLTIPHDDPLHFVTFAPDGNKLLTGTISPNGWQFPGTMQLWNLSSGKLLRTFRGQRAAVNGAVFDSDGLHFTSCGADGQLFRWNVTTGKQTFDKFRSNGLSHIALMGNGQLLVMRRFNNGVIVQTAKSMTPLSEFDVPTERVVDLAVSAQGNRIIAGTQEGPAYVWSFTNE